MRVTLSSMKALNLYSKLRELQGEIITETEKTFLFSQLKKILELRLAGEMTVSEAGKQIRKLAWKIAEDLHLNELPLGTGSDQLLVERLPLLIKP